MKGRKRIIASAVLAAAVAPWASAHAVFVDNGIVGDGFWQVDALDGGETRTGNLDPVGSGQTEVVFDYFHYVQVGGGGSTRLGDTNVTSSAALNGSAVESAGNFAGDNGTINWTASSSIAPGSSSYQTTITFSSNAAFGDVRLHQYLDEDVLGVSDDVLVVLGTPGASDFQLLTIDDNQDVGVSHSATYNTATGMSYEGWAARPFSQLRTAIQNGTVTYSIAGVVDGLAAYNDARFPGNPAYGTADITPSIAFDLDPNATFASVILALGGAPEGTPPPPPDGGGGDGGVPVPGTLLLTALGLGLMARRRQG